MNPRLTKLSRISTIAFFAVALSVSVWGYINLLRQKNNIQEERYKDINVVAELKAEQIAMWRRERMNDAQDIVSECIDKLNTGKIRFMENGEPPPSVNNLLKENKEYKNIFIIDRNFKILSASGIGSKVIGSGALAIIKEAIENKKTISKELYRDEKSGEIDLDICAPIIIPGTKVVSGAVVLRIDPNRYLYPLLLSNPLNKKTFETFLVKKVNERVIFLSKLRFSNKEPLEISFPLNQDDLISVKAANSIEGEVEGRDYRGVEVIASVKKIYGSNSMLIAKIDKEEVYSEIRASALTLFFIVLIIAFAGGAIFVGFIWYKQYAAFYENLYNAAAERTSITDNYRYLIHFASDIILVFNKDLKIVEANNMAVLTYGYSVEEFLQMNVKDLTSDDKLPAIEDELKEADKQGRYIFKTLHKRKDGTIFPVEVNCGAMVVGPRRMYMSIVRVRTDAQA